MYTKSWTELRGVAILWVVGLHVWQLFDPQEYVPFVMSGQLGVSMFLCLSTWLLWDKAKLSLEYVRRRIRRTWPLYFVALLAVTLYTREWRVGLSYSVFVGVFAQNYYVFWTVALEEVFYFLVFPLLSRAAPAVCVALFILSLVAGQWYLQLAFATYASALFIRLASKYFYALKPFAFLVMFAVVLPYSTRLYFVLPEAFGVAVLTRILMDRPQLLRTKILEWIGDTSYSIYLFHLLLLWIWPPLALLSWIPEYRRIRRPSSVLASVEKSLPSGTAGPHFLASTRNRGGMVEDSTC